MPYRAPRKCNYFGCRKLTTSTYCEEHSKEIERTKSNERLTPAQRGYDSMWQKSRKQYLKRNPLCDECYKNKRLTPATVVHHMIDHKGDMDLFWDRENWQPLCKVCHDRVKHNR